MATLQVRLDPKLKKAAQKVAKDLGMDLSTAIKIFLVQLVNSKGMPFPLRTVNGFTPLQEWEMLHESEEAKLHGKRYNSANEMFEDLLGKNWKAKKNKR